MATRAFVKLEEAAELELQGSAHRLSVAKVALADFLSEQSVVINGHPVLPGLRESLERQLHALQVEADEAQREYKRNFETVLRLRRTPTPR